MYALGELMTRKTRQLFTFCLQSIQSGHLANARQKDPLTLDEGSRETGCLREENVHLRKLDTVLPFVFCFFSSTAIRVSSQSSLHSEARRSVADAPRGGEGEGAREVCRASPLREA